MSQNIFTSTLTGNILDCCQSNVCSSHIFSSIRPSPAAESWSFDLLKLFQSDRCSEGVGPTIGRQYSYLH